MGITEIVLVIIGGITLVLSYVLPMGKNDSEVVQAPKIDEEQIKKLVEKEISEAKDHINDMVDETLTYSMEKTERMMERLSNEKIMAVNDYSNQVLDAINKNHQEVMFLYDMLNDKHENLVNTVSEAARRAKEITQAVQDAEITVREASNAIKEEAEKVKETEKVKEPEKAKRTRKPKKIKETETTDADETSVKAETVPAVGKSVDEEPEFVPISPKKVEIIHGDTEDTYDAYAENESFANVNAAWATALTEEKQPEQSINNNEKILRLHKLGKSQTAIARELGLGVGEVKLVIDLFEQA